MSNVTKIVVYSLFSQENTEYELLENQLLKNWKQLAHEVGFAPIDASQFIIFTDYGKDITKEIVINYVTEPIILIGKANIPIQTMLNTWERQTNQNFTIKGDIEEDIELNKLFTAKSKLELSKKTNSPEWILYRDTVEKKLKYVADLLSKAKRSSNIKDVFNFCNQALSKCIDFDEAEDFKSQKIIELWNKIDASLKKKNSKNVKQLIDIAIEQRLDTETIQSYTVRLESMEIEDKVLELVRKKDYQKAMSYIDVYNLPLELKIEIDEKNQQIKTLIEGGQYYEKNYEYLQALEKYQGTLEIDPNSLELKKLCTKCVEKIFSEINKNIQNSLLNTAESLYLKLQKFEGCQDNSLQDSIDKEIEKSNFLVAKALKVDQIKETWNLYQQAFEINKENIFAKKALNECPNKFIEKMTYLIKKENINSAKSLLSELTVLWKKCQKLKNFQKLIYEIESKRIILQHVAKKEYLKANTIVESISNNIDAEVLMEINHHLRIARKKVEQGDVCYHADDLERAQIYYKEALQQCLDYTEAHNRLKVLQNDYDKKNDKTIKKFGENKNVKNNPEIIEHKKKSNSLLWIMIIIVITCLSYFLLSIGNYLNKKQVIETKLKQGFNFVKLGENTKAKEIFFGLFAEYELKNHVLSRLQKMINNSSKEKIKYNAAILSAEIYYEFKKFYNSGRYYFLAATLTKKNKEAIYLYKKAIQIFEKNSAQDTQILKAKALHSLGLLYTEKKKYTKAINLYKTALKIFGEQNHEEGIILCKIEIETCLENINKE